MDFQGIGRSLSDERCGLYFLAGLDTAEGRDPTGVLTVHAAEGTINQDHEDFIRASIVALDASVEVRICYHSPRELYAPDSLESLWKLFAHQHIVADPTGAFARMSKLPELARLLRATFSDSIVQILWRAETSALVVVTGNLNAEEAGQSEALEFLRTQVKSLIDEHASADLKRAIRSVQLFAKAPAGRHTPIDAESCPLRIADSGMASPRHRRLTGFLARISTLAALIGLGALSAANATQTAASEDAQTLMPGITGLVGLTTLGENSYGLRNRYQAIGGLRLYFGDTGLLMVSALNLGNLSVDDLPNRQELMRTKPTRIAYG